MKKISFIALLIAFCITSTSAQELIVGGNMENEDAWTGFWRADASDEGFYEFAYTDDGPSEGTDGCFYVYGYGQSGTLIFQEVEITPGHRYSFTGAFSCISTEELANTWIELILGRTRPDTDEMADYTASAGDYLYALNSWMEDPYNNMLIDGTFQDDFSFTWKSGSSTGADTTITGTSEIIVPDTISSTTWYVSFKAGCWNDAGSEANAYIFLIDNLSLIDLGSSSNNQLFNKPNQLASFYPNPSNGTINVNLKSSAPVNYSVFNASGKIIKAGQFINSTSIDMSSFGKGIYLLKTTQGNIAETQKIIIK